MLLTGGDTVGAPSEAAGINPLAAVHSNLNNPDSEFEMCIRKRFLPAISRRSDALAATTQRISSGRRTSIPYELKPQSKPTSSNDHKVIQHRLKEEEEEEDEQTDENELNKSLKWEFIT